MKRYVPLFEEYTDNYSQAQDDDTKFVVRISFVEDDRRTQHSGEVSDSGCLNYEEAFECIADAIKDYKEKISHIELYDTKDLGYDNYTESYQIGVAKPIFVLKNPADDYRKNINKRR